MDYLVVDNEYDCLIISKFTDDDASLEMML